MITTPGYIFYTDSGYNNKTKSDGYYSIKVYEDGEQIDFIHDSLSEIIITSNEAEYSSIIFTLNYILNNGLESKPVIIFMDSKLVIEQLNKNWSVYSDSIRIFYSIASELLNRIKEYTSIKLIWIPREEIVKELGH